MGPEGFSTARWEGPSCDALDGLRKHSELVCFECGSSKGNPPPGLASWWVGDGVVGAMPVDCSCWCYP